MLADATPAVVVTAVEVKTSWLAVPGLTVVMVVVPTTTPEVAVIVLLPADVGVKVGKVFNTPAVKAAEVPVAPAVPPKVTVPVNTLGPLLHVLPLASFAVMLVKLPLTDVPAVAEAIVVGFITNWLIAPGLTVSCCVPEVIVLGEVLAAVIVGVPACVSV